MIMVNATAAAGHVDVFMENRTILDPAAVKVIGTNVVADGVPTPESGLGRVEKPLRYSKRKPKRWTPTETFPALGSVGAAGV